MGRTTKKDSKPWPPLEFAESPLGDKTLNAVNCDRAGTSHPVHVSRVAINENAAKWITNQFMDFECRKLRKGRSKSKTNENTTPKRNKTKENQLSSKLNSCLESTKRYVPIEIERKIHVPLKLRLEWSSMLSLSFDKAIGNETLDDVRGSNQRVEGIESNCDRSRSRVDEGADVVLVPDTPETEKGLTLKMRQLRETKRRLF